MRQGILTKAKKHNVSIEAFRDLPLKLYQAPRIFKSTADNCIVVLIDAKNMQNQPIVLPIDTMANGYDGATPNKINEVTSFYGKDPKILELWTDKQMELYNAEDKKAIGCSPRPSLIPGERTAEAKNSIQMFGTIPNLEKNGVPNETVNLQMFDAIPNVEKNGSAKVDKDFDTTKSLNEKNSTIEQNTTFTPHIDINRTNADKPEQAAEDTKTIGCSPRPSPIPGEKTAEVKNSTNASQSGAIPDRADGVPNASAKVEKEIETTKFGNKNFSTPEQNTTSTGVKPVAAMGNNHAQQGYDDIMARMARVRAKNASPAVSPVKDTGKSM
jgi:hypothetical protein